MASLGFESCATAGATQLWAPPPPFAIAPVGGWITVIVAVGVRWIHKFQGLRLGGGGSRHPSTGDDVPKP